MFNHFAIVSVDYTKCFQKSEFFVDDLQLKAVFVEMRDADEKRVNLCESFHICRWVFVLADKRVERLELLWKSQ